MDDPKPKADEKRSSTEAPPKDSVNRVLTPTPAPTPQQDGVAPKRGPKFVDEGPPARQ